MISFKKYLLTFFIILTLLACHQWNAGAPTTDKVDTLLLKINFHPAFDEYCETKLVRYDTIKTIQFLLRDNGGADFQKDTYYFKKMELTDDQYLYLDLTLVGLCRKKLNVKSWTGCCDGMSIYSRLIWKNDTNSLQYRSTNRETDSIGYAFSESLFGSLKNTFQDTIVTQYFENIESYIDGSKHRTADSARKLDRVRMRKYHWGVENRKDKW